MHKKSMYISIVIVVFFGIFISYFGRIIPIKVQIEYFDYLKSLSEVLFAILGIWLGIVYPNVLKELVIIKNLEELKNKFDEFKRLVFPALLSIVLICSIAIIRFLFLFKESIVTIEYVKNNIKLIRALFIFIAYFDTVLLIISFVFSIVPLLIMNFFVENKYKIKKEIAEKDKFVKDVSVEYEQADELEKNKILNTSDNCLKL